MHICVVGYGLHPPWNEGMKNTTKNLIEALREHTDLDVSVISSYDENCELLEGVRYAKSSAIKNILRKISHLGGFRIHEYEYDLLMNYRMAKLIKEINHEKEIDIFHLFFASHSFFSYFAKKLNKPVIAQTFGAVKHHGWLRILQTNKRIDAYITTSNEDISSLQSLAFPEERICKINPIIDTDHFKQEGKEIAREYFGLHEDDFIAGYIGNLFQERFPMEILSKIKEIVEEKRDFKFLIISHNKNEQMEKEIARLGISKNILYKVMNLSEEEKVLAYSALDVVLFPFSNIISEHKYRIVIDPPITMLEAMSCGKPVIASNILSIPYIIEDGINGFLVEPDDLEGFKRKIIEVMEGTYDTKKIGENARKTIIRDFNPKKVAGEVKKNYEVVLWQS